MFLLILFCTFCTCLFQETRGQQRQVLAERTRQTSQLSLEQFRRKFDRGQGNLSIHCSFRPTLKSTLGTFSTKLGAMVPPECKRQIQSWHISFSQTRQFFLFFKKKAVIKHCQTNCPTESCHQRLSSKTAELTLSSNCTMSSKTAKQTAPRKHVITDCLQRLSNLHCHQRLFAKTAKLT